MKKFKLIGNRLLRILVLLLIAAAVGFGVIWIGTQKPPAPVVETQKPPGSSLLNTTLKEFDDKGNLLWEVKSERADYRQDQKVADVVKVQGKFYKDGKPLIEATADGGVINQANREITLKSNVKAIALKDKITLVADNMVWNSDRDLLTATGHLKIDKFDQKISIVGKTLKANPSVNTFTIEKDVIVTSVKPPVEIKGEAITWNADTHKVFSKLPIDVLQVKDKLTLKAKKGEWDTKTQLVTLEDEIKGKDPKLDVEIETSKVLWNIEKQLVTLPVEFKAISTSRGLEVTAMKGEAQLDKEKINLVGRVQASFKSTQGVVNADKVEWLVPTQMVTGDGNVTYRQPDKNLNVAGDRAVANLEKQTVQVTGTNVITQITPQ
ncbi:LPS export ABC transporter periplasmic protein LptC [Tumidithrix helvetica PCC 7403]|uniref:LPS export ABC transporter periplasmic protein LptC n=1 Tax=Tumidithrix helvetica TaxID=3457545 RepID=UPI003CB7C1B9